MYSTTLIIFLCGFLAFSLSAVCGGGAGLIMMPILGIALPVTHVPAALSIGTVTNSASRIIVFYKNIRWDIVKWFVPAALPAVWLGAWLLSYVNPLYLQLLMGLFLVGNLPQLFRKTKKENTSQSSHNILLLVGFLSGFVSGLTGAVGLLFNRFYLRYGLSKEQIVATRAANELVLHIVKLILYAAFGLLTAQVLAFGVAIAFAAILSSFCMKWILPLIGEAFFKKVGYAAMVISGIFLLGESGSRISDMNHANMSFLPIADGIETKMQWQSSNFSLEFVFDEGFEYEQVIPMADLPTDKHAFIAEKTTGAQKVIIEEVFGFHEHSYEALVWKDGKYESFDF